MPREHLVYHWKHGWIPLTHAAALSKAHGNAKLADRYVPGASSNHSSRATAGKSARSIHNTLENHARIQARPGTYRGESGHHITGTDTRGRKVDVFVPGDRHAADRAIENIHKGRGAFDGTHAPSILPKNDTSGTAAPADARAAFRMGGPELRQHAAAGSDVARAELNRRAAKSGVLGRTSNRPTLTPPTRAEPPARPAVAAPNIPALPAPAASGPEQRKAESLARWESENRNAVPAGYTVTSRVGSTENNGQHMGLHTVHSSKGERVGSVLDRKNGRFLALYNGKQLGDGYETRREAFAALTTKHESVAAREAKKTEAAAKRQANAVPIGIFQPHKVVGDGTTRGDAAASKIKQSFKYKDHTVHIETAMTKEQTTAFLGDVHSVLLKSGHLDGEGITFHVPSGDTKFRQTRRGIVGGYVRRGQRAIYVNPKIANGEIADQFGGVNASDSFMPAARQVTGRQYVMTHELGHIVDNQHAHTYERTHLGSQRVVYDANKADANALLTEQRKNLSRYGQSNVAEGYAEAYAQWIHGGPGSSPAADAFAARFGWDVPKWYRSGRPKP